jgi:hypothetical protein
MTLDQEIAEEEALTQRFDAEQASVTTSFAVPEHLNLVVPFAKPLGTTLQQILKDIARFSELTTSAFENCHMTVATMPAKLDVQRITKAVEKTLQQQPLNLQVQGMHVRPPGVFLNVYSPDQSLLRLRRSLAVANGTEFDESGRLANVGWITLARFAAPPSPALIAYVQAQVATPYGQFTDMQPVLHRSQNSMQLGSIEWKRK